MTADQQTVIASAETACALAIAKLPYPLTAEQREMFALGFFAGSLYQIDRCNDMLAARLVGL